jgi:DNA-binding FrmR family transcriptional regulator
MSYVKNDRKNFQNRINRLIGQLEGIKKMTEEKRDCQEVIVQFQAVKSALSSLYSDFLNENLEKCFQKKDLELMNKIVKQVSKN